MHRITNRFLRYFLCWAAAAMSLFFIACENPLEEALPTFSLRYHANGAESGSVPVDSQRYGDGTTVTVLGNVGNLAIPGDVFSTWNSSADGSGTDYSPGDSISMGSADVDLYAQFTPQFAVGDDGPANGIIFYDKGSYSDGWRYLESAAADTSTDIIWGDSTNNISGLSEAIGSGTANTGLIVAAEGSSTSYAARTASNLSLGGQSDWFLPSLEELDLMRVNLHNQGDGNFAGDWYWSSSAFPPSSTIYAYAIDFSNGTRNGVHKDNVASDVHLRVARRF